MSFDVSLTSTGIYSKVEMVLLGTLSGIDISYPMWAVLTYLPPSDINCNGQCERGLAIILTYIAWAKGGIFFFVQLIVVCVLNRSKF